VKTNGKAFHQGNILGLYLAGWDGVKRREAYVFLHASIDRHPQTSESGTAVGFAVSARNAVSTAQIGKNGDYIALLEVPCGAFRGSGNFRNLHRQLMSYNTGIGKKWLSSAKGVKVCAADPYL